MERIAKLAPLAVLVAPGVLAEEVKAAKDKLAAAGFSDAATFTATPPSLEAFTDGAATQAA